MRQWFTIRNKRGLEWNVESEDFEFNGTLFPSSIEAYDLAVEMPFHDLRVILHTDLGGAVRTSTVWESK